MANSIIDTCLFKAFRCEWYAECASVDQLIKRLSDEIRPELPRIDRNLVKSFITNEIKGFVAEVCEFDLFTLCESIEEVEEACAEQLHTDFDFNESFDFGEIISEYVQNELFHHLYRHEAPWFSDGIKAVIAEMGYPITKEAVLYEAFADSNINVLIERWGAEDAVHAIESFWGPDDGYFLQYSESEILECWRKLGLVSTTKLKCITNCRVLLRRCDRLSQDMMKLLSAYDLLSVVDGSSPLAIRQKIEEVLAKRGISFSSEASPFLWQELKHAKEFIEDCEGLDDDVICCAVARLQALIEPLDVLIAHRSFHP